MAPPFGQPILRWARTGAVTTLARMIKPDVIMERYYNFGGEGVSAATRLGLPSVLEVNAPVVDYPGSTKMRLDRVLLIQPMRRWRERICRQVSLFVTTTADILPSWVDPQRVLAIEWGADVEHFRPAALDRPRGDRIICVFAGAFRSWHGVVHLAAALARLHAAGDHRFGALFVGDGPERAAVERVARGVPGIAFTGAVPHADLPKMLASADIGVAPFDPTRHRPLQLGFYWSPLKLFEYMAVGLPVVAPALPRLTRLVTHNREGLLYDPRDPRALDGAIQTLADDRLRRRMGEEARARVVRDFSWDAHCRVLSARLTKLIKR
jgi:glycosyltransferase involved in cell wall biosynthesis